MAKKLAATIVAPAITEITISGSPTITYEQGKFTRRMHIDHEGKTYYVDNITRQSKWDSENRCDGIEFKCEALESNTGDRAKILLTFDKDEDAEKLVVWQCEAECLPQWFIRFASSEAYESGHSAGMDEVWSIFESMIHSAKEKFNEYGKN